MAYVSTRQNGTTVRVLNASVLVAIGMLLGLLAAQFDVITLEPTAVSQSAPAIPGEDWHGNVKRSTY